MKSKHPVSKKIVHSGRRRFLRAVPAAVAAGLAVRRPAAAQPAAAQAPLRLGIDVLSCAEQIPGLQFTDAERDLMLRNVSTHRDYYDALRKVALAADVEPAFSFRPSPPPKRPASRPASTSKLPMPRLERAAMGASVEDLAFLPVSALAGLIETRKVSSTELTRMYLDRLKRHGGALECVVSLTEEIALEQAALADREIGAGRYRGPLHGIPYGVKDLFATKGVRTTWGAKPYENQMIDLDATVIERLRDAGAVLVAKLTTGELAIGDVWFGGKTRNPWNPERGSSGSSAGPAAATAAGLVAFAIGTETGGSIISPASTCGVIGLRPTYGRVSRHGAMTLRWTMDKVGLLARSAEDCALVLNAIHGPDGRDKTVADVPFTWSPNTTLSNMRIGFVEAEFENSPSDASPEERARWPKRKELLASALAVFKTTRATLEPITLPDLPARALYALLSAEAGAAFDELLRSGSVNQLAGKGPNDRANQLKASRFIPAVEYIQAQRIRTLLMRQFDALMARYDVFLAPSNSSSVNMTNLTGHPAVTLKAGFVDDLPQAIMITGRLYEEGTLLRVALAYQQATRWHTMHPTI